MEVNCTSISYKKTGYFSKIVIDYLEGNEQIRPFYNYPVNLDGIKQSIESRKKFPQQRAVLVQQLINQYAGLEQSSKLANNIHLIGNENTFTVTTAHQPNIFTGPLYFVYKILHAIQLADALHKELPGYNFVPVYYMGSEDADLDEIGSFTIDEVAYKWQTAQTGAVGRMKVDKGFIQLLVIMQGQLGVQPYGNELLSLFSRCYTIGKTIQQATLELVNNLFGEYGLIVLIPDNADLKRLFMDVVKKELTEGFSHKAVSETITLLEKNYKVQTGGRELNLFYLTGDKRLRLEKSDDAYRVEGLNISFSEESILDELEQHPERFSANVILRGVFQETVLPNIAFIGGGGELAYWLELKKVFESVQVPYPVLILRNSFLVIDEKWKQKTMALGLQPEELFLPEHELMNLLVERRNGKKFLLNGELDKAEAFYTRIAQQASTVDKTLLQHVNALKTKAVKYLKELEKKMLRAEKRKFEAEQRQLQKIKEALFPKNNLQERVENIAVLYSKYGKEIIDGLLDNSLTTEQAFTMIEPAQNAQ